MQSKASTPSAYIKSLEEPRKSQIKQLYDFIRKTAPELEAHMQSGMIGFGRYHYKYASGREGDCAVVGLASQKQYISVYVSATSDEGYLAEKYRKQFPRANVGKGCIRFKKVEDIDLLVLSAILRQAADWRKAGQSLA